MNYYAPIEAVPLYLTITTHSGVLTHRDIIENLMRMILMDQETDEYDGMDAETAMEELEKMSREEYQKLYRNAEAIYIDIQWTGYFDRTHLHEGLTLYPLATALQTQNEDPISEEEALDVMWENLNEFSMNGFTLYELPDTEWD